MASGPRRVRRGTSRGARRPKPAHAFQPRPPHRQRGKPHAEPARVPEGRNALAVGWAPPRGCTGNKADTSNQVRALATLSTLRPGPAVFEVSLRPAPEVLGSAPQRPEARKD